MATSDTTAQPSTDTTAQATAPGSGQSASAPPDQIQGTVTWPDGTPAAHAVLEFFVTRDQGPQSNPVTDGNGNYSLQGVSGLPNLYAEMEVTDGNNNDGFNNSRACWIPLTTGGTNYDFVPQAGETVNFTVVQVNCNEVDVLPQNIPDLQQNPIEGTATWQQAEAYLAQHPHQ